MNIDGRYIDLIARNKNFVKLPRWFAAFLPLLLAGILIMVLAGHLESIPAGIISILIILKNLMRRRQFLEKYRVTKKLPAWEWPNGGEK